MTGRLHLNWPAAEPRPLDTAAHVMAELPLVETGPGFELLLSLVLADGSKVSVLLGTAEAVAIGAELLQPRGCAWAEAIGRPTTKGD
jgi:hypothetical protein